MALLKLGAFITQISGKVGGQSFGNARGGNYIKNIGSQINPRSKTQLLQRSIVSIISSRWRALTELDRKSFEGETVNYPYVNRVGEIKTYSAFNLFQKLNMNLASVGIGIMDVLQNFSPIDSPVIYFQTTNSNNLKIRSDATDGAALYQIWSSPSLSAGISNPYKYLRQIGVVDSIDLENGFAIQNLWQAVFGTMADDSNIFVVVYPVRKDTGLKGLQSNLIRDVIT